MAKPHIIRDGMDTLQVVLVCISAGKSAENKKVQHYYI